MKKELMNIKVNYSFNDKKQETTLVFLHGWGQNINMMLPLSEKYNNYYNTLVVDLPGFGESDEPDSAWSVYEYATYIKKLVDELNLQKVILIGHSFGGKIALVYSSIYDVEKLVCFGSPYCKELKKLPLKNRIYKRIKKIYPLKWLAKIMQNHIGSTDYKNASEVMRGVLVKSVNLDITEDVKKIKCPTLLIWGSLDTAAPLKRAYELEKLIPDSAVILYEGATHYAYLERLNDVVRVLDNFFNVRR